MTLKNYLKLSWLDKKLIIKTLIIMTIIRIMLTLTPFTVTQQFIHRTKKKTLQTIIPVEKLIWSVKSVSQHLPTTTCLTDALTAQYLLKNNGYTGEIKIGVDKDAEGQFEAHAWLEYNNQIILGKTGKKYTPLYKI
jgi:hypothetical protein